MHLMMALLALAAVESGTIDYHPTAAEAGVPAELRLRAGVHCGEAVVTADDLIGHDVNVTARVAGVASGGEVLATAHLRDQVGEMRGVEFGRARRKSLKGVGDPVSVCPVTRR